MTIVYGDTVAYDGTMPALVPGSAPPGTIQEVKVDGNVVTQWPGAIFTVTTSPVWMLDALEMLDLLEMV